MLRRVRVLIVVFAVGALAATAQANWLSKLAREAADGGGMVASRSLGAVDNAAALVKRLPANADDAALAAHATPEGHWQFVNRNGEVFTAGTAEELKRALPSLAPEAARQGKVQIYLSEETVFARPQALAELPGVSQIQIAHGKTSYPLTVSGPAAAPKLTVVYRPHLKIDLTARDLFDEAVAHLSRPLNRSNMRSIAFEPGGPAHFSSAPKFETGSTAASVDAIDPGRFASALPSLRGQTAVMTGRVAGDVLHIAPASGPAQSLRIPDLVRAAEDADVNLVILDAASARQPGGRNWLWLTYQVDGLDDALSRATFGDFLEALAMRQGGMTVTAARAGEGRIFVRAAPQGSNTVDPAGGGFSETLGRWTGEIIGQVASRAVDVHARDLATQEERDRRIIPGVPASLQFAYLGLLVCGIIGHQVAWAWFARLWPPFERARYRNAVFYRFAAAGRFIVLVLVVLPLVGIPAVLTATAMMVWNMLLVPVRFAGWLMGKFRRQPAAS